MEAVCLISLIPLIGSIASSGEPYKLESSNFHLEFSTEFLFIICLGSILIRMAGQIIVCYLIGRLVSRYDANTSSKLLNSYLFSSWQLQSEEKKEDLNTLLTVNINKGKRGVNAICNGTAALLNFTVLFTAAMLLRWEVALVLIVVVGFLFIMVRPLGTIAKKLSGEHADILLDFYADLGQTNTAIRDIKLFNILNYYSDRLNCKIQSAKVKSIWIIFLSICVPFIYQNLAAISVIVGLALIYFLKISHVTALASVALLMFRALRYSQNLQGMYHNIQEAIPMLIQIQDAEDRYKNSYVDTNKGEDISHVDEIQFDRVSFKYDEGDWVIRNIDFTVNQGEMIGVVGPSGAGKSTLIQLLLGIREPIEGNVLINSRDLKLIKKTSWFDQIKFVPQEPIILRESVFENIQFFQENITREDVINAAQAAGIHEEIMQMPEGYHSLCGEQGGNLSGGQKQRICIARVLASNPNILVFDEPTSALDAHSEATIQKTLSDLKGQTTTFIIAHRLSTLNFCDRIMVLNEGSIQSFGSFEELTANDGYFQDALRLSTVGVDKPKS